MRAKDVNPPSLTGEAQGQSERSGGKTGVGLRASLLLPALLFAVMAAYHPAWHGGMLWDDSAHITPASLRSVHGLWLIWTDLGATQQYYPVLHSTFWLLHRLWGNEILGYHLLNIIIHGLSAFLIAVILRRLNIPGAGLAAVVFALHPVQVESVAWMAELKNVLSGVFYLCGALLYLRFDRDRQQPFYAAALVSFVLAVLSKTVTATLPAALLVVFWWQRGRLRWFRDILPLSPFFVFGASAALLTVFVERASIGARGPEFQLTFADRCLIAGRAVWFYLGKLFWPTNLSFMYPRWQVDPHVWWQYLFPLGLAILLAGLWLLRKQTRAPLAAMLLYCGTLFPVLGFFNVYPFRYSFVADHFQYLACIGIFALIASCLSILAARWKLKSHQATTAVVAIGCMLAFFTWDQSREYTGAETLYRSTIRHNPSCWLAYGKLGSLLLPDRPEEAVRYFMSASRLRPDLAENHYNLANALQMEGDLRAAAREYREALRLQPDFAEAHNNLGSALQESGLLDQAVVQYREALRLEPDLAEAHNNLGNALQKQSRFAEAIAQFGEALKIKRNYAAPHFNLGVTWQELGHPERAEMEFKEALRIKPDYAEARIMLSRIQNNPRIIRKAVH